MTPAGKHKTWEALYRVFQRFALDDQRSYYQRAVKQAREAAGQVNFMRAFFALLAGLASAVAGYLVATYMVSGAAGGASVCAAFGERSEIVASTADSLEGSETEASVVLLGLPVSCDTLRVIVVGLTVLAIGAPALGAAFTTLADLYQWDRLASIYEAALENLEVADAQSPVSGMTELEYRAALRAYAEGALAVMRDETAQWGQVARAPAALEKFLKEEYEKAARVGGAPVELSEGRPAPPESPTPIPPPNFPDEPDIPPAQPGDTPPTPPALPPEFGE